MMMTKSRIVLALACLLVISIAAASAAEILQSDSAIGKSVEDLTITEDVDVRTYSDVLSVQKHKYVCLYIFMRLKQDAEQPVPATCLSRISNFLLHTNPFLHRNMQLDLKNGRKLLASCSILGKSFKACYNVNGGVVGYSKSGSTLSVGFRGGSPSGWAGWSVGNPHKGSSAVMNIQGTTSTRTMKGQSASLITSPSKVKFGSVKGGTESGALAATFTMKWPGSASAIKIAFASGQGNLIQHIGKPRTYLLNQALKQV
jgi:hypothetical protein